MQTAAYCTHQGRMLALIDLFCIDDVFYLRLPRERVEPILKRLQMFVLRSQVELEDVSEICFALRPQKTYLQLKLKQIS